MSSEYLAFGSSRCKVVYKKWLLKLVRHSESFHSSRMKLLLVFLVLWLWVKLIPTTGHLWTTSYHTLLVIFGHFSPNNRTGQRWLRNKVRFLQNYFLTFFFSILKIVRFEISWTTRGFGSTLETKTDWEKSQKSDYDHETNDCFSSQRIQHLFTTRWLSGFVNF